MFNFINLDTRSYLMLLIDIRSIKSLKFTLIWHLKLSYFNPKSKITILHFWHLKLSKILWIILFYNIRHQELSYWNLLLCKSKFNIFAWKLVLLRLTILNSKSLMSLSASLLQSWMLNFDMIALIIWDLIQKSVMNELSLKWHKSHENWLWKYAKEMRSS